MKTILLAVAIVMMATACGGADELNPVNLTDPVGAEPDVVEPAGTIPDCPEIGAQAIGNYVDGCWDLENPNTLNGVGRQDFETCSLFWTDDWHFTSLDTEIRPGGYQYDACPEQVDG